MGAAPLSNGSWMTTGRPAAPTRVIAASRDFLETLRHHDALVAVPGYDLTLGLHRISLAAGAVKEALPTRDEDSLAVDYCKPLDVCIGRLVEDMLAERTRDMAALEGVAKAIAALESLQARRRGVPAGPAPGPIDAAPEAPPRRPTVPPAEPTPLGTAALSDPTEGDRPRPPAPRLEAAAQQAPSLGRERPTAGPGDGAPIEATLTELADLLEVVKAGTVRTPDGPLGPALKGLLEELAERDEVMRGIFTGRPTRREAKARIDRINGIERLRVMYYRETARELETDGAPYVHRIIADLADNPGMTLEGAKRLTVAQAVASLAPSEPREDRPADPPVGPTDAAPAGPAEPFKDAPRVIMAPPSPLLADPDWVIGFCWMVERLLGTARKLARHGTMPTYRQMLLETEWKPSIEGLAAHVMKAVEDGRNGPPIRTYVLHGNVPEAYQLAYAMLREMSLRARPDTLPIPITALEGIHELLANWQAPANPAAGPTPSGIDVTNVTGEKREGPSNPLSQNADSSEPTPFGIEALMPEGEPAAIADGCRQDDGRAAESRDLWSEIPPVIDYEALATALRKRRKRTPAALVEYMASRTEATAEEIAEHVHGDPSTGDNAIWNNAKRASDALASMGSPLWFRFASGRMFREIGPE